MCAACGCGCKPGKAARGCDCNCKTCKGARMSVEKSFVISKAMRNFDAIADALLSDDFDDFEKADESKASTGRYATGILFPGIHGAVAGKPGKKLRAAGNELGGNLLGSAVGGGVTYGVGRSIGKLKSPRAATAAAGLGGLIGYGASATGSGLGVRRAQRKGQYKSQDNQD